MSAQSARYNWRAASKHAALGAIVPAAAGGTDYTVGEGGQDEVIATVRQLQSAAVSPSGGGGSGAPAGGSPVINVTLSFAGATFNGGPAGDIAKQWAKALAPEMAEVLGNMFYKTIHGAGH